jgi:lysophospholipase L1-like esterase
MWLALTAWPLTGCSAEPLRVMALGDSITQGAVGRPGYLPGLLQRMQERGCRVETVGSMHGEYGAAPAGAGLVHEGHWGWRADQVLQYIDRWAKDARPDLVLVHLGTNDLGGGEPVDETLEEIAGIVGALRRASPHATILLGQIIPTDYDSINAHIVEFNRGIAALALQLDRPDSPVRAVDHYRDYDPDRHNYDGIHPNPVGATLMATRWIETLEALGWFRSGGPCSAPA